MRILVIDDDRSVGEAIQALLSRQGSETVPVESGKQGILVFAASSFDALMVDIFMPEMDGLETIKRLRQQSPTIPIIAMSGFRFRESLGTTPDTLEMATKLGATNCLRKPFGSRQLMAAITPYFNHSLPRNAPRPLERGKDCCK